MATIPSERVSDIKDSQEIVYILLQFSESCLSLWSPYVKVIVASKDIEFVKNKMFDFALKDFEDTLDARGAFTDDIEEAIAEIKSQPNNKYVVKDPLVEWQPSLEEIIIYFEDWDGIWYKTIYRIDKLPLD